MLMKKMVYLLLYLKSFTTHIGFQEDLIPDFKL